MPINEGKWMQTAEPQRPGKQWCWAAALAAVARYQVDTTITQEDFINYAVDQTKADGTLTWETYMVIAGRLDEHGIEYHRVNGGARKLKFMMDVRSGFDKGMALAELNAGRPVITTIQGGAHDLVVIGIEALGTDDFSVKYWNPFDNGIGELTSKGFLDLNVVCTVSAEIHPQLEQIAFVSGGFLQTS